ncbi:MAG: hypothetical protein DRN66_03760 [Candidatus Nanohalarchaeota archaeon]|nr:MAG: hypothetical protein DRN66_03760 [Candidatus Nanohaloarchaeota archaeon]
MKSTTIIIIMLALFLFVPFCSATNDGVNINSAIITTDIRDANWLESIQCKYNLIDNCAEGEDGYLIIETPLEAITDYYFKDMYVDVGEKAYFCAEITWDYASYLSDKNTCGATLYTSTLANTGGCSADISPSYYMLRKQYRPDGATTTVLSTFSTPHQFGDTWKVCSNFYPVAGSYVITYPTILTKPPTSAWRTNFINYGAKYAYDKDTSVTGIIAYASQQYSVFVTATPADKCKDVTCPNKCQGDYVYHYQCNPSTGNCDYSSSTSCKGYGCSGGVCNTAPVSYCGDNIKNAGEECDGTAGVPEHYVCLSDCTLKYIPYCGDGTCDPNEDYTGCPADCSDPCAEVTCHDYCEGNTAKYAGQCNPSTGECMYQSQVCDDRCVEGVCEGQIDKCTGVTPKEDHCIGNVRQYGGSCDPASGLWVYDTELCPNACISGVCTGGSCTYDIDCNDNNPDTTDKCTSGVCANTPIEENELGFLITVGLMGIALIFGVVYIIKKSKKKVRRKRR